MDERVTGEPGRRADPPADPPGTKTDPTKPGPQRGPVALLLALAAVAAASIGARASLVTANSSDRWQAAVRQEAKRSAATVEDVRYVYTVEAPRGLDVASARIWAEELRRQADAATGVLRTFLLQEARVQETLADTFSGGTQLVEDPAYGAGDGFDVGRFLADTRNAYPDLVAVDPDQPMAEGDEASRRARRGVATTIPVAGAFVAGALGQAYVSRRRLFVALGFALLAVGVVAAIAVEVV